jgi:hypothetical protein
MSLWLRTRSNEVIGCNSCFARTEQGYASRDRSNIRGIAFFVATLLSFVVYTLLLAHEIPARQG